MRHLLTLVLAAATLTCVSAASYQYAEIRWNCFNKCLTVPPNGGHNSEVYLSECKGLPNQLWMDTGSTDGNGVISVKGPKGPKGENLCLRGSLQNGDKVLVKVCGHYVAGIGWWYPTNGMLELSHHAIVSGNGKHEGYCADVANGNPADGTPIQMWQCYGDNPNQRWHWGPVVAGA